MVIRVHALDIKLMRDLRRLWAQALAIALVLACGVAMFLTGNGMVRALDLTRQDYYAQQRFADVFATLNRAPLSLLDEIRAIPGVQAAEARISGAAVLDLPDRVEVVQARVVSLPPLRDPAVNVPILVTGRLPEADGEVAVSDRFARAAQLLPGSTITVRVEGREIALAITGTVVSPEFVYTLPPGGMMPDDDGFGLLWMPEHAAASAFDMSGAFNDVSLTLRRDGDEAGVIDRLDRILAPWGGTGAVGRADQTSNAFIEAEVGQLRAMARVLPPVFFGVAAFLVNLVLGRIVQLERSEIGLLKALGYRKREIAFHYLVLALLVAAGGVLIGWAAGAWLASGLARLYAKFYDFPWLVRPGGIDIYAASAAIAFVAAGAGALRSALDAARLPPAVAMQPPAPPHFRHSPLDGLSRALALTQPTVMILRSVARWPLRSALTVLGLGAGVAILVAAGFFTVALDRIVDVAFLRTARQHASLVLTEPQPLAVVGEVLDLPGVLAAEPQFDQEAILRNGHRTKRVAITARPQGTTLARVLDDRARPVPLPPDGLLLSTELARALGLRPGDRVEATLIGRRAGTVTLTVAGTVTQYMGLGAYMDLDALAGTLREVPRATAVNILIDPAALPAFHTRLKDLPRVASFISLTEVRRSFAETIRENVVISTTVYLTMALLITVGVAYNGARVQLSERARELASMRILGFTRAEVSYVLLGETGVLALAAQPVGWALGAAICWLTVRGFESDLYRLPFVFTPEMCARASLIALGATLAAALVVRRRLDRADLVAVMKTRE